MPVESGSIAIIGMSGAFPGSSDVDEFWTKLCRGEEMIRPLPGMNGASAEGQLVRVVSCMDGIDLFDAEFFGITPAEAEITDPQHRILLEHSWRALECAGYDCSRYKGVAGIFAGATINTYLLHNLASRPDLIKSLDPLKINIGNGADFLVTRICYKLNLHGPGHTVQSACSTSLVAVHCACRSLLDFECDMALAGGVSINVTLLNGYRYQEGGIASPDGHCRVFDAQAQGTIFGGGVGVVVLKRLEDALADNDCIHAVIRGSAVNNDGAQRVGFTAPGVDGQAEVIVEALGSAGLRAENISYVECHGTGTPLGDPVEIRALSKAFGKGRSHSCALGSVKSNVGHLDAAAGVTGLIKTVLCLKHKMLPPSLHFRQPNPQIDFSGTPFYVNTELSSWKGEGSRLRAGVSAFGVGGTNAHVIVEEAPEREKGRRGREWEVLVLSARTAGGLKEARKNLGGYLAGAGEEVEMGDVAYTLQVGRREFGYRWSGVYRDRWEAVAGLEKGEEEEGMEGEEGRRRKVGFLFPGQGSQYVGMGKELYEKEKVFRESMEECEELLRPELGVGICEVLYGGKEGKEGKEGRGGKGIDETWIAQAALVAVEYSLVRLWGTWGVKAEGMIGHSVGEYTAACVAGVMSLGEVLGVVAERGRLMQEMGAGGMLAVGLGEEEVRGRWLREREGRGIGIGAVNGEGQCVVSGREGEIEELQGELERGGISCRRLRVSHAFHSEMVEGVAGRFREKMKGVNLKEPEIRFISNVTGRWIEGREARDAEYWVRHLREPVQFGRGLKEMMREEGTEGSEWVLVEVGPGEGLKRLVQGERRGWKVVGSMGRKGGGGERSEMLRGLGELWRWGQKVEWEKLHSGGEKRYRVPLPTYPFERKRYWIEPSKVQQQQEKTEQKTVIRKVADVSQWFWYPTWKTTPLLPSDDEIQSGSAWMVFLDDYGLGLELASRLKDAGLKVISVGKAPNFSGVDHLSYAINPENPSDYASLVIAVRELGVSIEHIVHLWSWGPLSEWERSNSFLSEYQTGGLLSLLYIAQALVSDHSDIQRRLWVVCSDVVQIESVDRLLPEKSGLLAVCKVLPQEDNSFRTRVIDLDPSRSNQQNVDLVMAEMQTPGSDALVAYRGPYRWTQGYEHIQLNRDLSSLKSGLRQGGVYLITGGLGAVSLLIARWIVEEVRGRLVLVGRSPFPSREKWNALLQQSPESAQARQIEKLMDIEALGAEFEIVNADVADLRQMRAALARARERFGGVDGVIHAAGVTSGPSVFRLARDIRMEDCDTQARPKALGVMVLEQLLREFPVDFVFCVSSNAAVLGGLGSTAYCAANIFLDAFVQRRQTEVTGTRWISTNWDHWPEETRKLTQFHTTMDEFAMTREEAKQAFFQALGLMRSGQLIIATADLQKRANVWVKHASEAREDVAGGAGSGGSKEPRPKIKTVYIAPRNKPEETMAEIWARLLGLEKVGINDDFFELGGHSLLATRLLAEVRQAFDADVSLANFFEGPTVAQMASHFGAKGQETDYATATVVGN